MIKSIFKIFISLLSIFLVFIIAFYFYGSSGKLQDSDYITTGREYAYKASTDTFSIMTYNVGYLSGMSNNKPV